MDEHLRDSVSVEKVQELMSRETRGREGGFFFF